MCMYVRVAAHVSVDAHEEEVIDNCYSSGCWEPNLGHL